MNNATRLLVLVTLAGLVALIGILALSDNKSDPAVKHTYIEQEQTERIWVEQEFESVKLKVPLHEALYNPGPMKLRDDNIYIIDYGDMLLKRFSLDGELLNTIGLGRGQGPGELGTITDYYVRDSVVWIADPDTRSVSMFTTEGTYLSRFTTPSPMPRITRLPNNNLVLMAMMNVDLFHEVDTTGELVRTFGELVMDQTQNAMALDGTFAPRDDGGFIYAPTYASYLYYYDASGVFEKLVQTIDRLKFPGTKSEEKGVGVAFFAPTSDIVINNTSVHEGIIYLHSKFTKKKIESGHLSVLDRYDLQTGSYISSTRLPFPVREAVVYGDRLYCSHDTTVTVLRFKG